MACSSGTSWVPVANPFRAFDLPLALADIQHAAWIRIHPHLRIDGNMTGSRTRATRFVLNPISTGRHPGIEDLIRRNVGREGRKVDIARTARPGHATEIARQAAAEGVRVVVAVGGDGTIHEVANGLVGTDAALGIVPTGTGNALARAMGVPLDPAEACRSLAAACVRPIDVGRIDSRYFLTTAGVGIDAEVSRRFAGTRSGRRSFRRYALLTAKALRAFRPESLRLEVDGAPAISAAPLLATVANTPQYGHGATIAPGAVPDDGLLDLCILEGVGAFTMARHAYRLFNGTIDRMPGYRRVRVTRLRILRPRPGPYQADGESLMGGEVLEVHVVPKGLKVALPEAVRAG